MQVSKRKERKKHSLFLRVTGIAVPLMVLMILLSQTVFAQNTYRIKDGDRVVVHTSSATDPADVLNEAGLALGEDDTYTTQSGLGMSEITIRRSRTVTIDDRGQVKTVSTIQEEVGKLLKELKISVEGDVAISVPLDSPVHDGMHIQIRQILRTTETYTASIPFTVTYCNDSTIPAGTEVVVVPGVDGQVLCTASVVYVGGEETSRTVLEETVISQPVAQVVAVGTGSAPRAAEEQKPIIANGTITLPTGEVLTYTHTGVVEATAYTHTDAGCDFITATGTTVRIGTVAVDPRMIPYGTRMFIVSNDGSYIYGVSTAEDCGGDIKGDRIDLYFPTYGECIEFGRRNCTIYFLG